MTKGWPAGYPRRETSGGPKLGDSCLGRRHFRRLKQHQGFKNKPSWLATPTTLAFCLGRCIDTWVSTVQCFWEVLSHRIRAKLGKRKLLFNLCHVALEPPAMSLFSAMMAEGCVVAENRPW